MNDSLQGLIVAWSESPLCKKKLSARQLLRLSKGPLRKALNATKAASGATKPNVLGMFLNANKDMLCVGHYIRTDFDAHIKQFIYFLEKVSDDELRRLEFEASIAEDKRQEAARESRFRRVTPKSRPLIYLSPPNTDWFSHEKTAQRLVDILLADAFDASIDYCPGGGLCVVRIQRSSFDDIKDYCRKHRMEYHRVREIGEAPIKPSQSEQVWNDRLQRWISAPTAAIPLGYVPEAKFLRRALGLDRHSKGAIRLKPLSRWSPFDV